tara:strand:- start:232 stop:720 length:489 start_codon:yes stop_codon:yes gene_type:complete
MTYFRPVEYISNIETAIINCKTPSATSAGGVFTLSGTPTANASISSNQLTLSAGYHYYLEASILVQNSAYNGQIEWSFYDNDTSDYIGQTGFMNLATSTGNATRIGRRCCRALILNSGSDQTIDCRIKAISGSSWNLTITTNGISTFGYVGYPSLRIWELPA